MSNKGEHLEYISNKGLFQIDCDLIVFSKEEIQILEKWGHWFMALISRDLKPFTEAQESFIKVINGESEAISPYEKSWNKYLNRKKIDKEYGDKLKAQYKLDGDRFYPREDIQKMKCINFERMSDNHFKGLSEK